MLFGFPNRPATIFSNDTTALDLGPVSGEREEEVRRRLKRVNDEHERRLRTQELGPLERQLEASLVARR